MACGKVTLTLAAFAVIAAVFLNQEVSAAIGDTCNLRADCDPTDCGPGNEKKICCVGRSFADGGDKTHAHKSGVCNCCATECFALLSYAEATTPNTSAKADAYLQSCRKS